MEELREKWPEVLEYCRRSFDISDVSYETFLKPLKVYELDGQVNIIVADEKDKDYIEKKYAPLIKTAILEVTDRYANPEFFCQ